MLTMNSSYIYEWYKGEGCGLRDYLFTCATLTVTCLSRMFTHACMKGGQPIEQQVPKRGLAGPESTAMLLQLSMLARLFPSLTTSLVPQTPYARKRGLVRSCTASCASGLQ